MGGFTVHITSHHFVARLFRPFAAHSLIHHRVVHLVFAPEAKR